MRRRGIVLTELHITEFALIEELRIELGPGFTVITGETGAGKSIVIDALSAAVGDRAGADTVRTGAEQAVVEATFDASAAPKALAAAAEAGVEADADGTLILTRVISTAGRHRCRVNGRSVPLSVLREIGDRLVDIHGQHEHQALIRDENHLQFLDGYAGPDALSVREEYARTFEELRAAQAARDRLAAAARDRLREVDLLRFQAEEIRSAALTPGEEEELLATRERLSNLERLREGGLEAHGLLAGVTEEGLGAVDAAREALRRLQDLAALDRGLGELAASLETAAYQLEDAAGRLSDYLEGVEGEPDALDEIEQRLALIGRLRRKYGDSPADVIGFGEEAAARLAQLERADERLGELAEEIARLEAEAGGQATRLSGLRREAAARLGEALTAGLGDVGMEHGKLEVELTQTAEAQGLPDGTGGRWLADARGIDTGRFRFSANPGEPLKPLAAIASGGELSRVMLLLKSVCSRGHEIPTVVFDEVDAGIGGRATHAVGNKLAELSRRTQVLCVTHLPQIARLAGRHFHVSKGTRGGRTRVALEPLDRDRRVAELARMLGAGEGDRAALQHAAELLEGGR
ncbi:MAG: DNA repair protein RecN [Armatimonadetes bacterium]|nr:DNA repair protein RecN [Armatimonadota bacterium]